MKTYGWIAGGVVAVLFACGGDDVPGASDASASDGGGGSGGGSVSGVPGALVVSALSEADRATLCTWVMAQAASYVTTWGDGRLCTASAALVAAAGQMTDPTEAREDCIRMRDLCLMNPGTLLALDCAPLVDCDSTVASVETYYAAYDVLDAAAMTCETLMSAELESFDPQQINVLPSCTLVGVVR